MTLTIYLIDLCLMFLILIFVIAVYELWKRIIK